MRKRKELELQILNEAIRGWEGEDIKTLGTVLYMSQVMIQCAGSEVSIIWNILKTLSTKLGILIFFCYAVL